MSIDERLISTTTPDADAPAVVVRTVGGGGAASDVTVVDPIGQKTMAESVAVTMASDQTPIVISGAVITI